MSRSGSVLSPLVLGTVLSLVAADLAESQSGSRYPIGSGSRTPQYAPAQPYAPSGSSTRSGSQTRSLPVGLSGYCPVCIIDRKQWVRGSSRFQASFDGKSYYFPNQEIRQTFLADPGKYVPALGGDCTVCLKDLDRRIPGSVYHAAYHRNRLYLFPGDEQKQKFVANPASYADADLALEGLCAVCKVDGGEEVPGDPRFATYHRGLRYLFAGEDQLNTFRADPEKYLPAALSAPR